MRDARCVLLLLSKACSARRFALRAVLPCLGGGSHPLTRYGHTLTYVNIEGVPPQAAKNFFCHRPPQAIPGWGGWT